MMDNGNSPARPRLPLLEILWGAFVLPWRLRGELVRRAYLPLLAVFCAWLAMCWYGSGKYGFFLYVLQHVTYAWLAVSIYRLVLLGGEQVRVGLFSAADLGRLGRSLAIVIGLWILFYIVDRVLSLIARPLVGPYLPARGNGEWDPILFVTGWLAQWPVARLTMMLPAVAVDGPAHPVTVWKLSRGNSLKLLVIVAVLPQLLEKSIGLLFGNRYSLLQAISAAAIFAGIAVIAMTANSLAYRRLTAPVPPPTDPHG